MRLSPEMVRRFADDLHGTHRTMWGKRIVAQAKVWGVDQSTLRRRLKSDAGFTSGRTRKKKPSYVAFEDAKFVAAMMARTMRKGRHGLTIELAIELAWNEGRMKSIRRPSVSAMQRRMAEMEISPSHLTRQSPHTRMRTTHAGQVHQIDASLCIQYEFSDKKGLQWRYVDTNKLLAMKNVKNAIHRWVLVDHLSGYITPMYFDSPGERTEDLLKFLHYAWGEKDDPRIPFCGIPDKIHVDQGSVFKNYAIRHLCEAYGIDRILHKPGLARATGSAESAQWQHERRFEAKLRLQRIDTVKELIELATLEAIAYNTTRAHSRHGMTRAAAWMESVVRPVRVPVESFEQFCYLAHGKEETRKVEGDLCIKILGRRWYLTGAQVAERVTIKPHPFNKEDFRVFSQTGIELDCVEVKKDKWGFYDHATNYGDHSGIPKTEAQHAIEAGKGLEPFRRAFKTEKDLPKDIYSFPAVPTVPARHVQRKVELVMSRVEAKECVVEELGRRLSREEGKYWSAQIGEGCTREALESMIEAFRARPKMAVA